MDKQNGQLVATLSQPVSLTTAFRRITFSRSGASVSVQNCPPPAPQHVVQVPHSLGSTVSKPLTLFKSNLGAFTIPL